MIDLELKSLLRGSILGQRRDYLALWTEGKLEKFFSPDLRVGVK